MSKTPSIVDWLNEHTADPNTPDLITDSDDVIALRHTKGECINCHTPFDSTHCDDVNTA